MKTIPPFEVKVNSSRGAPMGRPHTPNLVGKVHLQQIRLYDGDYDKGGAYWGSGQGLWCIWNDDGEAYLRASSRKAAKVEAFNEGHDVTFYR